MTPFSPLLLAALVLSPLPLAALEVHGHRGSRGTHPENTLAGFDAALAAGVDVLELDLGVTKDGALVAAHDPALPPELCLGPGGAKLAASVPLRSLTLKELAAYDCGSLKNPRFPRQTPVPGQAPPSLDAVFDLVERSRHPAAATVRFNIETKLVPGRPELSAGPEEFARLVAAAVRRRSLAPRVIVQSFDHRVLRELRRIAPELRVSALVSDNRPDYAALVKDLGADVVSPDREWVSAADVRAAHDAGAKVAPWTANDEAEWTRLAAMGVDAIITDYPADLIAWLERRGARGTPAAAAKLAVVVSVDQMRGDYLRRFSREWTGGFARLMRDGASFTRARHASVPTETSPGHAALLTGCFPSQHGIVANEWWDRAAGKPRYSVDDDKWWRGPASLQCDTLGDALKAASPASRVVSVAGKDRAAILMGGKRPDLALWYDKSAGQYVSSGYYGRMPDWAWDFGASLKIPASERETLTATPRYDLLTLQLAKRAIAELELGGRAAPDLIAIGLSAVDIIGHAHGPDSPQVKEALFVLDRELGVFFDELDRRLGAAGWVLALSADHGVVPVPETASAQAAGGRRVPQTPFMKELEAALVARFGARPKGGRWLTAIYAPHVYVDGPAEVRAEAARLLKAHPAVAHVYAPADLAADESASGPFAAVFRRTLHPRSGDLFVLFKEGALFEDGPTGTGHGSPYDDDARVPLVFAGPGVRPGLYDDEALATDLAPTLGRLLGVNFPARAPSRVLYEALGTSPAAGGAAARPAPTAAPKGS